MSVLRIHFLVPAAEGQASPIEVEPAGHPIKITPGGRFICACDPAQVLDDFNRATGEPWGVRCKACIETDIFQQMKRPKPGRSVPDMTEAVDNGCCG